MNNRITDLQNQIALDLVSEISNNKWFEIILNTEVNCEDGHQTTSSVCFYITSKKGVYKKESIRFGYHKAAPVLELWKEYKNIHDSWSTLDLRVYPSGKVKFDFSYEPPLRMSGSLENGFENYLDNYTPPEKEKNMLNRLMNIFTNRNK
jgi:hypothetical protein